MAAQTTGPAQILLAEDNAPDVFLIRQALQQIQAPHQLFVVDDGDRLY